MQFDFLRTSYMSLVSDCIGLYLLSKNEFCADNDGKASYGRACWCWASAVVVKCVVGGP